jgi:WG containing repeat
MDYLRFSRFLHRISHAIRLVTKPRIFALAATVCVAAALSTASYSQTRAPRPISVGGKWGYVNLEGKIVIPPQYARAEEFSEGLAVVEVDGSSGQLEFINEQGSVIIQGPKAGVWFGPMSDGLFYFEYRDSRLDAPCGFADKTARIIIKLKSDDCPSGLTSFREGIAPVGSLNYCCHYINKVGRRIPPQDFESAGEIIEGFGLVKSSPAYYVRGSERYGYVSAANNIVIGPKFLKACDFGEGLAAVREDDAGNTLEYFVDITGNPALTPGDEDSSWQLIMGEEAERPEELSRFASGLAPVWNASNHVIYIGHDGKQAFDRSFSRGTVFAEGLAVVVQDVVDKDGQIVKGSDAYAEEETAFIDKTGKTVASFGSVVSAEPFLQGLSKVKFTKSSWGYVNGAGKIVWQSH